MRWQFKIEVNTGLNNMKTVLIAFRKKRYRKVLPYLDTIAIKIFSWDLNK